MEEPKFQMELGRNTNGHKPLGLPVCRGPTARACFFWKISLCVHQCCLEGCLHVAGIAMGRMYM